MCEWDEMEVERSGSVYGVGAWVGRECEDSYVYKSNAGRCTSEHAQK